MVALQSRAHIAFVCPTAGEGLNILQEGEWAMERIPPLRTNFPETWLWLDTNIR